MTDERNCIFGTSGFLVHGTVKDHKCLLLSCQDRKSFKDFPGRGFEFIGFTYTGTKFLGGVRIYQLSESVAQNPSDNEILEDLLQKLGGIDIEITAVPQHGPE